MNRAGQSRRGYIVRRHRDRSRGDAPARAPLQSGGAAHNDAVQAPLPIVGPAADTSGQAPIHAELARGFRLLRFAPELERSFNLEAMGPRRRHVALCGLIGMLCMWITCADLDRILPDFAAQARATVNAYLVAWPMALAVVLGAPRCRRRPWHSEALIAGGTAFFIAAAIWWTMSSRADTAFTSSTGLVVCLTYASVCARLRFLWGLVLSAASLAAYVLLVHGHTPLQRLIVESNVKLIATSIVFVLLASYTIEYNERRNWLLRKLHERQRAALDLATAHLRRLSSQDALTGLCNKRGFDAALRQACTDAASGRHAVVSLLMVDVDHFKRYNDTYGHPQGDACLVAIGRCLADLAGQTRGLAARVGGEEFALLLAGHGAQEALHAAQRLGECVRRLSLPHHGFGAAAFVTVSIGVAHATQAGIQAQGSDRAASGLLARADAALYEAKRTGRDRAIAGDGHAGPHREAPPTQTASCSVDASSQPEAPEQPYLDLLRSGFRWLQFPSALERDYREHDADARRNYLLPMIVLGLVSYDLFVLSNRPMFADIPDSSVAGLMGLSGVLLLCTVLGYLAPVRAWWREGLVTLGCTTLSLSSVWMLSHSAMLTMLSYCVYLVLTPMYSGMSVQQPFWFALVPALALPTAVWSWFHPVGAEQALVFRQSFVYIANLMAYNLILAYMLDRDKRKAWLLGQVHRLRASALEEAMRELQRLSMEDALTGLPNRRQFDAELERAWQAGRHAGQPAAMLIIDVDDFKLYNDHYGHPMGDECLKAVAWVLRDKAASLKAVAGRLGGEEFGLLLPDTALHAAVRVAEQLCAEVRALAMPHGRSQVDGRVSVSVGVAAALPAATGKPQALIAMADEALYLAKTSGRDRVGVIEQPMGDTEQPHPGWARHITPQARVPHHGGVMLERDAAARPPSRPARRLAPPR